MNMNIHKQIHKLQINKNKNIHSYLLSHGLIKSRISIHIWCRKVFLINFHSQKKTSLL